MNKKLVLFIAAFAGIGLAALVFTRAAEDNSFIDLETSSISGNAASTDDLNAINGRAVQFNDVAPPTTPTEKLPFDMPTTASLRSSGKKVFANYFNVYPLSSDNAAAPDYYDRNWLAINGDGGIHASYGGLLRDRPIHRAPLPALPDWQLEDMKTEVRQAIAAGIDGWALDILKVTPGNVYRQRVDRMIQAANIVDPNFKIMLMPDYTAPESRTPAQFASEMAIIIGNNPSIYKLADGRVVISPFFADRKTPEYWRDFVSAMQTNHGIRVALVPCFLSSATASSYLPFSYGLSHWGPRDPNPVCINEAATLRNNAHSNGKIWMQPVALQDMRPKSGSFFEAGNSDTFHMMWDISMAGAEWVQMVTWNDYSEHSEFNPSDGLGYNALDLNAYELVKYKTGAYPTIRRDTIYISHRKHMVGARGFVHSGVMNPHSSNRTAGRDFVEVTTFLTSAATVTVRVGADTMTYQAPAGRDVRKYPLKTGTISASAVRNGSTTASITSPRQVTATPQIQDLFYYLVGSRRSTTFPFQ